MLQVSLKQVWEFTHRFFERFASILWAKEWRAICLWKRANRSHCSFFMSDLSEALTVALFSWVTWANCSLSLFCTVKSNWSESLNILYKKEWMSKERREEFTLGHKMLFKMRDFEQKSEFQPCPKMSNFYLLSFWKVAPEIKFVLYFVKAKCKRN